MMVCSNIEIVSTVNIRTMYNSVESISKVPPKLHLKDILQVIFQYPPSSEANWLANVPPTLASKRHTFEITQAFSELLTLNISELSVNLNIIKSPYQI